MSEIGGFLSNFFAAFGDADVKEGRAIIVTFLSAIVTASIAYIASGRRDNRNLRNSKSADFYDRENEELEKSLKKIEKYIFDQKDCCKRLTHPQIVKNKKYISYIINHFERAAVGISSGYLSESYIIKVEKFRIVCAFMSLSPVISDIRDHYGNKNASIHYERLFLRNYFPGYRAVSFLPEVILGRPIYSIPYGLFHFEYYLYRILGKKFLAESEYNKAFSESYLKSDWVILRNNIWKLRRGFLVVLILFIIAISAMWFFLI
ncbi:DUF4760 domain-containing protein [Salaquimonas pukyongi]|uniref:DUF4760 domain-containing protein n=1 Tax=Salaquimonas pukyongi TaxID=2712698 RepID=UPI0012EC2663|nr:DUF4760 domain-containing protein [Salaquimonas pukyongi]